MACKVSVCCATYGHEAYLNQAVDSILRQKVSFEYEIIIGEDCSPDNSRALLKTYEDHYPGLFKMIYHEKNIGAQENFFKVYSEACGEYVVVLELDDFWIDEDKLQKQVDYLDTNKDVFAVAHRSIIVDKNGEIIPLRYPDCRLSEYDIKLLLKGILPGQTTTVMYRNYHHNPPFSMDLIYSKTKGPGDRRKMYTFSCYGRIACLPEYMSCYRMVTDSGFSFSAQVHGKRAVDIDYWKDFVKYSRENQASSDHKKVAEALLFRTLFGMLIRKEINVDVFNSECHELNYPGFCVYTLFIYYLTVLYCRLTRQNYAFRRLKKSELKEFRSIVNNSNLL